jgi:serine/threonine protein kinase
LLQGKTQGLVLGPYVLADAIGQGSMGQVYRAISKTDSQTYAVKVLPRRSMWNVRLARRQVRAFGQFTHPAVVPFIDVGTAGGQHYLVWPLAEGESLEARVTREMKLPPDVAAQIVLQIAQGLAQANQHGLFHGLIKPSNILIGSDGQARILDFGIGSLLAENEGESLVDTMSTANTLTSGLDCASPESVMDPTNRTTAGDQYSLGCVLYYCLSGQYPFPDGTAVEKMMGHQFKQPTPIRELVPAVPEGLAAVVDRLMQKAPEARYSATEEIVEALQPFAAEARRPNRYQSGGSHHGQRAVPKPQPAAPTWTAPAPAQITTPPGGPLTPVPNSQPAVSPAGRPARPAQRPLPSRASVSQPSVYPTPIPTVPDALPVMTPAPPSHRPQALPANSPSGWVEPPKQGASFGLFMVFILAALVTVGVYFLGKNFLFPN